jgi:hypothetical protein
VNVPLGQGAEPGQGGPRPTAHQLRMAHVRADATGESLSHVLSVFMGVGRHGEQTAAVAEPVAAAADGPFDTSGPPGPAAPAGQDTGGTVKYGEKGEHEATEELATVIPLFGVRGRRGHDGGH